MEIRFEWHTKRLDEAQKKRLESEIIRKVAENIETLTRLEITALAVSLNDETEDALVVGEIFRIEGARRDMISRIKINHGFLIECKNVSWFQPRKGDQDLT